MNALTWPQSSTSQSWVFGLRVHDVDGDDLSDVDARDGGVFLSGSRTTRLTPSAYRQETPA